MVARDQIPTVVVRSGIRRVLVMLDGNKTVTIETEYLDRALRRQVAEMQQAHLVVGHDVLVAALVTEGTIVCIDSIRIGVDEDFAAAGYQCIKWVQRKALLDTQGLLTLQRLPY